jgi:hypothetical protein
MKIVLDSFRWIIAFAIIYLITHFSLIGIFYATEFIFRIAQKVPPILIMLPLLPSLVLLGYLVSIVLLILCRAIIVLIVKQQVAFSTAIMVFYSIGIIFFLILFWKGIIVFGWQGLKYHRVFTLFFSLFFIGLLVLPFQLRKSFMNTSTV